MKVAKVIRTKCSRGFAVAMACLVFRGGEKVGLSNRVSLAILRLWSAIRGAFSVSISLSSLEFSGTKLLTIAFHRVRFPFMKSAIGEPASGLRAKGHVPWSILLLQFIEETNQQWG